MTTFTRLAGLLCGAFLVLSPVVVFSADEAGKPAAEKKEAKKGEGKKAKTAAAPWLKGIELTDAQTKEIAAISEIFEPQIKERQKNVEAVVSPEKVKEVNAKVKKAREEGTRGAALQDLRKSSLGLSDEKFREYNGLLDLVKIARNEYQAKVRGVLTAEQHKQFDENVAAAKPGAKKKAAN